ASSLSYICFPSLHDALPILLNAGVVACTGLSWRHVLFTRSCRCIHTVHRPRKATFPVLVGFSGDAAMTTTTWKPDKYWECCLTRSEEHTSELQSRFDLVCRL